MRKYLILFVFLLLCCGAAAATDSLRLGYSAGGAVVDAITGKALESVHVSIPGRRQATVTNADGVFVLKSDKPFTEVEFSFLGYRTLRQKAQDGMKVLLLRENLSLDAASIITGNPREIVRAALDNIWDSYCTSPQLLECFYRETLRKHTRYTYVAEAVARLYKSTYSGGDVFRDAAALEKSRILVSQKRSDTLSVKTQGGPTMAINLDLVKNSSRLFSPEDLGLYSFEMLMPQYIGDRLQFVIGMTPREETSYALYNCTLYIDRELLTFTRIEASLDMSDRAKATEIMLVKKPQGLRFHPQECSIVVSYTLKQGIARLEYLRSTMRFRCDWKKRLFKTEYTAVNELVVTDVRPEAVPIGIRERFRTSDFLGDKAAEFSDPDFWADYNIIEPSESLEHAIKRLRRNRSKN